MKATGSRNKGFAYERVVAKQLSAWASAGTRTDIFWRSPGSGSRASAVTALAHGGDITATHELGHAFIQHVVIECKCYARVDWRAFLVDQTGPFWKFWQKVEEEGRVSTKLPVLLIKERGKPSLMISTIPGLIALVDRPLMNPLVTSWWGIAVQELDAMLKNPYDLVCSRLALAKTTWTLPT